MKFTPSPIVAQWKSVSESYRPLGGQMAGIAKQLARYEKWAKTLEARLQADLDALGDARAQAAAAAKALPAQVKKNEALHKEMVAWMTNLAALESVIRDKQAKLKKDPKNKKLQGELEKLIKKHGADNKTFESRLSKLIAANTPLETQHAEAVDAMETALHGASKAHSWT